MGKAERKRTGGIRNWSARRRTALTLGLISALTGATWALSAAGATVDREALIVKALAPTQALLERNATALCAAFTPDVAAELVRGAPPGADCATAAASVFAATAANEPAPPPGSRVLAAGFVQVEVHGSSATVSYLPGFIPAGAGAAIGGHTEPIEMELRELGGHWLVSSPALVAALPGCRLHTPAACGPGSKVLAYSFGAPFVEMIARPPAAVRRAGGRLLAAFEAGRRDVSESGCLACHRIGVSGNRGPGPNLSRVGARRSRLQIEGALIHPRAPMPSFSRLPPRKLHDIVIFLSQLR